MKTRTARLILLFVVVLVLAALPTVGVLARGLAQDAPAAPGSLPIGEIVLNMGFVATITAFLKNLFSITGKPVYAVAFGVFVVVWGVYVLIPVLLPNASPYVFSFMLALEAFLGTMGSYDLVTDVRSKVASIKPTKTVEAALK